MWNFLLIYFLLITLQYRTFAVNLNQNCLFYKHSSPINSITVFTRHYEPYMYLGASEKFEKGIEFKLMQTIGQQLGKNIIYLNCSTAALMNIGKTAIDKSNVLIGGLSVSLINSNNLIMSLPYDQDDLRWCVRKAELYPAFLNMFFILSPLAWFLLILMIFLVGTNAYIYITLDEKYKCRNYRDWHYVILLIISPTFLGICPQFYPQHGRVRLYYATMLLLSLVFNAFFTTYLYNSMKVRYLRYQIASVDEIINNNYRLIGTRDAFNVIKHNSRYPKGTIDMRNQCDSMNTCLKRLLSLENNKFAVVGSRKNIENNQFYSPSKIYCFDESENINSYQVSLFVTNGSDIIEKIDEIIRRLFEAGLFVKWNRDSQRSRKYEVQYVPPIEMTFEHISFNFYLVMTWGSLLSTLVYIFELIVHRMVRQRKQSKFWIYLDHHLTGIRYYFRTDS